MGNKQTVYPKSNEVYLDINAGIGNQYFMIAAAYAYCREHNLNLRIPRTWKGISKARSSYWDTLFHKCRPFLYDGKVKTPHLHKEKSHGYERIPIFDGPLALKGYFQSDQYFSARDEEVRSLFEFPYFLEDFAEKVIRTEWKAFRNEVLVAVHIRRGDYLKHAGKFPIVPIHYYLDSKKRIEQELGFRPRYIYFTDDPEWVEDVFTLQGMDFIVRGYKDYEDFVLMSKCHHFIIANSTFSWWAAYLSKSYSEYLKIENNIFNNGNVREKIVIVPSEWFGPRGPKGWQDLYPKSFTIMNSKMKSMREIFFMGVISCQKYADRRAKQDLRECIFDYKYFVGKPELTDALVEGDVVYLPCKDNYESLPEKVHCMLKWIVKNRPDVEYVVKNDDDVRFDFKLMKDYTKYVYQMNLDYAGNKVQSSKTSSHCKGKCYFISRKSISVLIRNMLKENIPCEEESVGFCLGKAGISPINLYLQGNVYH